MTIILEDFPHEAVTQSRNCLENGGILLSPTDTIYGLGCDASHLEAVEKIRDIKGRKSSKPFIVLVGGIPTAQRYFNIKGLIKKLPQLWPGPFTVLLEPKLKTLNHLAGPTGKVAVRMPGCEFLAGLFKQWKGLLVSTSANLSGEPYRHSWEAIEKQFIYKAQLLIRKRGYPAKRPSAVVEVEHGAWKTLREGPLPLPF